MGLLSVESIQGRRDYMEDKYAYISSGGIEVALVADGHGGYQMAERTAQQLPYLLYKSINDNDSNIVKAEHIRDTLITWGKKNKREQTGSTLSGIVKTSDTIFIYNIGDSRTCIRLYQKAYVYMLKPKFDDKGDYIEKNNIEYTRPHFFCTIDHNFDNIEEINRAKNAGGILNNGRLNGILNLLRTIGDADVGKGISFIPDIYWTTLSNVAGPILLYTDGLYERYNDAVELYNNAEYRGASFIVNMAYNERSEDNITALLVE